MLIYLSAIADSLHLAEFRAMKSKSELSYKYVPPDEIGLCDVCTNK